MYLDLVGLENFKYTVNKSAFSYVNNEKLYLTKNISVEKIMIAMAHQQYGNACKYCGRKFSNKVIKTIDHIYPINFGGITILPNLVPCCTDCNQEKSNLTAEDYLNWKLIKDTEEQERFRYGCIGSYEKEQMKRGTILPKEWFEKRKTNILADINIDKQIRGKKLENAKRFYWKYGMVEFPIVISRNSYLLDGFISLWVSKEEGIVKVPVIKLDNVIILNG